LVSRQRFDGRRPDWNHGGTAPSFGGAPTAANPFGSFPGQTITDIAGNVISDTTIPPSVTDGLLSGSLRNTYGRDNTSIPALATFTGILTDPQFRVVLKAIETGMALIC
jgi:hypothetical protein